MEHTKNSATYICDGCCESGKAACTLHIADERESPVSLECIYGGKGYWVKKPDLVNDSRQKFIVLKNDDMLRKGDKKWVASYTNDWEDVHWMFLGEKVEDCSVGVYIRPVGSEGVA